MKRPLRGTSEVEAEEYLASAFSVCSGFELLVLTTAEAESRDVLREGLIAAGAEITVVEPSVEAVVHAPRVGPEVQGHRTLVRWFQADEDTDEARWRELAVALNRSRERLRDEHRYLWVLAGPLSLRQIMTLHAQDIYSGAYRAPHVSAHAGAEISWLHLSDLRLGEGPPRATRQGGDFWRNVDELFLPDLQRELDVFEAGPDMVLVSGDLGFSGQAEDYVEVDRFFDRLLDTLEKRSGSRPLLLTVPGNHDVARPRELIDRWPFEVLSRYEDDDDDPYARALRDRLWKQRDASVVEPLFTNYCAWVQRRVVDEFVADEIGMEPGVLYSRSLVGSHFPGDFSAIVEKDDLRVGIVGLNTAWAAFDDDTAAHGLFLTFEQFHTALGERGLSRLDEMHQCMVLTHHGPRSLSETSRETLEQRIYPLEPIVRHMHGHVHTEAEGGSALATRGYPLFDRGPKIGASGSGYTIARIRRDGGVESRRRVLVPIAARGAWRFDAAADAEAEPETTPERPTSEVSPWTRSLAKYFEKLESLYGTTSLLGFGPRMPDPVRLDDLLVPLRALIDLSIRRGRAFAEIPEESAFPEHDEIALIDALRVSRTFGRRGVVILGDPGSGKTMHLRRMLLQIIKSGPESVGLPEGTIPILVSLRNLRDHHRGLEDLIESELSDPLLELPPEFGHELLRHERLLFLLDGLNEVESEDDRHRIARWIEEAHHVANESYFVLTCRYISYTSYARLDSSFVELHLRPLNSDQVRESIIYWYRAVEAPRHTDPNQAAAIAEWQAHDLLKWIFSPEAMPARIYELTHNPLLLTLICMVHRDRGQLPITRGDIYGASIEILLERWRWFTKRPSVTVSAHQAMRVLQSVALWLQEQEGRTRATGRELRVIVEKSLSSLRVPLEADEFLRIIRDESGMLIGGGVDEYEFRHLGFQEYLAAKALRGSALENPGVFRDLADHFGESWWQEVILLMLGLDDPAVFEVFMREVVQHSSFVDWSDSTMMHICLREAAEISPRPFVELVTEPNRPVSEHQTARQLAALRLLARAMPEALTEIEDSLRDHPVPSIKNWWREYQGGVRPTPQAG